MSQLTLPHDVAVEGTPDSESLYEIVNGESRESKDTGAFELHIASVISVALANAANAATAGRVSSEMIFDLRPDQARRPDVAFVSFARWPQNQKVPRTARWNVIPDLAVEVVSPGNSFDEVERKVGEYFEAGVTVVWLVSSGGERVYVYDSPTSNRILTRADTLELPELIPGFSLQIGSIFDS